MNARDNTSDNRDAAAITEVTDNAAGLLLGARSVSTIRGHITPYFGEYAGQFDLDAIEAEYREAINEVLPDGVTLAGEFIFRRVDTNPDWDELGERVRGVDFEAIVARHEIPLEPGSCPACRTGQCSSHGPSEDPLPGRTTVQADAGGSR